MAYPIITFLVAGILAWMTYRSHALETGLEDAPTKEPIEESQPAKAENADDESEESPDAFMDE